MNATFDKIADYFGTIGMASIACWLVACGLMLLYVCGLRRSLIGWPALAAAIAGIVLANINSDKISAIQIDFSEELQEAQERAEEEEAGQEGELASTEEEADAVEDQAADDEDAAGEDEAADVASADTDISEDEEEPAPPGYAYRQQGKVERTAGKEVEDKIEVGTGSEDQPPVVNVRTMKMPEVAQANRLDRVNLFFARLTLALAVLLATVDYFRRFNMTFRALLPLPVGGPTIDSFFPKTRMVCVGPRRKRAWKKFMKRVVRKGETFIFLGDDDPLPARRLGRLPLLPKAVWSLDKITRTADDREFDNETLFESAWFGRGCFAILDDSPGATNLLTALAGFLQLRHATRAAARHTVNVIWAAPGLPTENSLSRLAALCPETNFKLLVSTDRKLTETQKKCFDEIVK